MLMNQRSLIPVLLLLIAVMGCSRLGDLGSSNSTSSNETTNANVDQPSNTASGSTTTRENPSADIDAMADKFLEQKSFRARMLAIGEKDKEVRTDMEFAAPDRFRIKTGPGLETIVIGKDLYISMKGSYMKLPGSLPDSIPNLRQTFEKEGRKWFSGVRYVGEEAINGEQAYVYEYKNRGPDKLGENDSKIWVGKEDGLPLRIESRFESGNFKSMTIEYEYDPNIKIEAPSTN